MTKKIETNPKASKFNVNDRVRITKYKNVFSKGYIKNWSAEIFIIDSALKIILELIKLKLKWRKNKVGWVIINELAEFDKSDINKLFNFPTSLNNFETNANDLNVCKFKNVPVDLKN